MLNILSVHENTSVHVYFDNVECINTFTIVITCSNTCICARGVNREECVYTNLKRFSNNCIA